MAQDVFISVRLPYLLNREVIEGDYLKEPSAAWSIHCNEEAEWTRRDLNPGPLPCQGSDLPLIYEPACFHVPEDPS